MREYLSQLPAFECSVSKSATPSLRNCLAVTDSSAALLLRSSESWFVWWCRCYTSLRAFTVFIAPLLYSKVTSPPLSSPPLDQTMRRLVPQTKAALCRFVLRYAHASDLLNSSWLVQVYTVSKATAGLPQGSVWLLCSLIGAVLPELLHQTMSAEEMEVRRRSPTTAWHPRFGCSESRRSPRLSSLR